MTKTLYESILEDVRLPSELLWPIPILLDITEEAAAELSPGDRLTLRDDEGMALAILTVEDKWRPDLQREAERVFATATRAIPV